ncbi:hypothetical protein VNO77_22710 [Canavalia gladiata]|uniref:Uncharacterized protein n=1 Tax=Canavalia gladiata TaxID=3824 RepID=A0AAN9L8C4_CANGL
MLVDFDIAKQLAFLTSIFHVLVNYMVGIGERILDNHEMEYVIVLISGLFIFKAFSYQFGSIVLGSVKGMDIKGEIPIRLLTMDSLLAVGYVERGFDNAIEISTKANGVPGRLEMDMTSGKERFLVRT